MGFWNTLSKKAKQKIFQGFYSRQIQIPPKLTTDEYLKEYGNIGWLYAAVSKISQNVANTEWKAYNKAGEPVENSLALQRLLNPNPFYSLYDTLELTSMYLELVGKAFWYLAKDRLGRVKEIWVISPSYMYIIPDMVDHIKGFVYQDGAQRVPLEPDEVIFFNYQDPTNPYGGVSPANATASALESDKYASEWNRNFFYNSAEPQGVITVPNGLDDNEYERLKREWNDKYGGVDNAKKTAILEGGASYQSIQISQKDMDFTNLRNMNRDEILGVFGVPKSILGLTDAVNRANAETAEYTFSKHTVTPKIMKVEGKINNEFVPLFGEDVKLKHTDIIPKNKDFILQIVDTQVDKTLTKNEGRKVISKLIDMELEPLEFGDVIYQPVTLQPMGAPIVVEAPPVPQPKGIEAVNELLKSIEQNKAKEKQVAEIKKKLSTYYKSLDKEKYKETFNDGIEKMVQDKKSVIKEIFDHQLKVMLANINNGKIDECVKFLDSDKEKEFMTSKMKPIIEEAFINGGKGAFKQLEKAVGFSITKIGSEDVNPSFNVHDPLVSEWIIENTLQNIDWINETTRKVVQEKLVEWELEGLSIQAIAEKLKEYFEDFSIGRLERIARTEIVSSTNAGTLNGYKQSGVVEKKEWLATAGSRTRDWHASASGQVQDINDPFIVDGEGLDFPGDPNGSAGNVINCRCTILPYFE